MGERERVGSARPGENPTAPRTLYVSDLDGTLLGAESSISRTSVRLLNETVVSSVAAACRRTAAVEPVWFSFEDGRDRVR